MPSFFSCLIKSPRTHRPLAFENRNEASEQATETHAVTALDTTSDEHSRAREDNHAREVHIELPLILRDILRARGAHEVIRWDQVRHAGTAEMAFTAGAKQVDRTQRDRDDRHQRVQADQES